MALNNIYLFAEDATNILNNVDYEADSTLETGILAGSLARSELHNKIFKQATICAAGLSQFAADNQDEDIDDSMTVEEYADALTAAIDSRVAEGIDTNIITQPQFDNQAVAATDEFVNRALGSYSYYRTISATSTTLTAADVGKIITYKPSPNADGSWVLPDYTGFRLGSTIEIVSNVTNSSILTITPFAGQNIQSTVGIDVASIKLGFGDSAKFALIEKDSTLYWLLVSGTASLPYSLSFNSVMGSSGYYTLPGGLVFQWGVATFFNVGATEIATTVTFPAIFSTACYHVTATANGRFRTGDVVDSMPIPVIDLITTSSCRITTSTNDGDTNNNEFTCQWFAIGV